MKLLHNSGDGCVLLRCMDFVLFFYRGVHCDHEFLNSIQLIFWFLCLIIHGLFIRMGIYVNQPPSVLCSDADIALARV